MLQFLADLRKAVNQHKIGSPLASAYHLMFYRQEQKQGIYNRKCVLCKHLRTRVMFFLQHKKNQENPGKSEGPNR